MLSLMLVVVVSQSEPVATEVSSPASAAEVAIPPADAASTSKAPTPVAPPQVTEPVSTPVLEVAPPPADVPPTRRYAWIPVATGAALAATGGLLLWQSEVKGAQLRTNQPPVTLEQAGDLKKQGTNLQGVGRAALLFGLVTASAGGVMYLMSFQEAPVKASAVVSAEGGAVSVQGSF